MILLDTQVLVWFAEGEPDLKRPARKLIEDETKTGLVVISPITFWEVSMLVDKGKLTLGRSLTEWMEAVLDQPGFRIEPVEPRVAVDAGSLPGEIHGDPADRIIIATARHLECPVLTTDRKIIEYAAAGHIQAIDARL